MNSWRSASESRGGLIIDQNSSPTCPVMRLSLSGVLMLLYVETNRREVNSPLLKEGKYLIEVLNVFVGLTLFAAMAERVLSTVNLNDLFGDQLNSVMKLPPA